MTTQDWQIKMPPILRTNANSYVLIYDLKSILKITNITY